VLRSVYGCMHAFEDWDGKTKSEKRDRENERVSV
jgi:hypothetical protein